ncbi:protein ELF4-LIKE 4 isoform X2 [Dendrobium catenatum]|uniref:protein ELF4-LIKE 4 isoform X2 n=1 Tax=Dendrobium catenatum TaxID=906689 RepID=UPI0009F6762E|nr:protein ELF4-LIKE 4 isoform X2 [Dendrobium catenatum]
MWWRNQCLNLGSLPSMFSETGLLCFGLSEEIRGQEQQVMEGDAFSGLGNGSFVGNKVLQHFNNSFGQVQSILDQNRLLINEINQNHESKIPDNLSRNVRLIRELNNNIRRVVDLYADLSTSFSKSMEDSSNGDSAGTLRSDGKAGLKRVRSG